MSFIANPSASTSIASWPTIFWEEVSLTGISHLLLPS